MTKHKDLNDTEHIKKLQKEMENPPQGIMSKEISDESQKGMEKAKSEDLEEMFKGMKKYLDPSPQNFLENVSYPRSASILQHDLPPESQGNVGSCTSQAVCGSIQNKYAKKTGKKQNLSESYLWWRQEEKPNTLHSAITATKYWMVLSDFWGYYAKEGRPGWLDNKVCTGKNARELSSLEQMMEEIAGGNPVIFSFSANFNNFAPNGYVNPAKATVNGAHAVQVSAYNLDTDTFTCRNSWGNHGDNGYLHFPMSYVRDRYFWTNFVCFDRELLMKEETPPAPPPAPKPISYDVRIKANWVRTFAHPTDKDHPIYHEFNWIFEGAGVSDIKSWEEKFKYGFPRGVKPSRAVDMSKESKDYIQTWGNNFHAGNIIVTFTDGHKIDVPLNFPKV